MSSFSFIHAADLHLDSPFKSIAHLDPKLADRLISESQAAFNRLIQRCIDEKVDFLLISGDTFDSGSGNLSGQLHFLSGMKKLESADIPVYLICGNHDPLDKWSRHLDFPSNVYQFSGDQVERIGQTIEGKSVGIYGISYPTRDEQRNLAQLFKSDASDVFSIGVLHGNFGSNTGHANYAPFTLPDLQSAGMDYWALGHIHKRQIVSESQPLAIYPGNIQGRHFNETGLKGCVKIHVEKGDVHDTKFLPLSEVVFERLELDISDVDNLNEFHERLAQLAEDTAYGKEISMLVRLTLKGATPIHSELNEEDIRAYFHEQIQDFSSHFIYIDRIIDITRPAFDIEERIQSADFVGDVLRRFESLKQDESRLKTLTSELFEDIRSSKFNRYIPELSERECLEILERGQWNLIERLIQDKK